MIEKSHRWHRTAITAAAIALLGLSASEVSALSLGRISVQSALVELLRAEIDVPSISAEEAASLKANVASPAAFLAAGLEYNPAMAGLQVTLARRADGRAYIRLSSDRAINDPFIDIILEASWSSGRIVRDYTMLFDPPSLKQAAPAPTLAQTPAASAPAPAKANPAVAAPVAPVAEAPRTTTASKPAVAASPKAAPKEASAGAQQTVVKPGDSASAIAARSKADSVSLDQMLVAMLRANPDAFTKGNLNRLRAGAVLDLPSTEQAKAISPAEAAQTVTAQSKDFNEFRRNLAGSAPKTAVEAANRKAAGKVEARVDDKKPGSAAVDKLTLSKGALQAKADEARLLKERADSEAAARAAELAKNIADLNKLSVASAKQAAPLAATPASQAATALPAVAMATNPALAASAATPAASAVAKAVVAAPAKAEPSAAPAAPEPGVLDQLMEDPTLPLAGGGLLALLAGLFLYRRKQGKKSKEQVDSSFLESRVQPDSFFGASGGQHVDTAQAEEPANSSQGYTNSQLGSADDVDPVAEADVYLAYGRDMQAEEILKEALRHNPERLAIHSKMLEIYVKRRDAASFQASANNAFQLVGADSPEWAHICEMGLSIDPENPLYQPGGATASAFVSLEQNDLAADDSAAGSGLGDAPLANTDLDLDLDFSAEEARASAFGELPSATLDDAAANDTVKIDAQNAPMSNDIDFDIPELDALDSPPADATPPEMPQELADLSLSLDDFNLDMPQTPAPTLPAAATPMPELPEPEPANEEATPAEASDGMLEFDLGSLSLDLGPSSQSSGEEGSSAFGDNSLETKLALAEEFVSIGDNDGARALIEEVVAEASGELREKAQRALASLS